MVNNTVPNTKHVSTYGQGFCHIDLYSFSSSWLSMLTQRNLGVRKRLDMGTSCDSKPNLIRLRPAHAKAIAPVWGFRNGAFGRPEDVTRARGRYQIGK